MLCIQFVAEALRSEEEGCQRRGLFATYFFLDPFPGSPGRKSTTPRRDHKNFIPTKFHENWEVENINYWWMDGQMDVEWGLRKIEPWTDRDTKF